MTSDPSSSLVAYLLADLLLHWENVPRFTVCGVTIPITRTVARP